MSATPQERSRRASARSVPGFAFGELNDLESFAGLVDADTAAILVESIQGDGGVNPCTAEFLVGLRGSATSATSSS